MARTIETYPTVTRTLFGKTVTHITRDPSIVALVYCGARIRGITPSEIVQHPKSRITCSACWRAMTDLIEYKRRSAERGAWIVQKADARRAAERLVVERRDCPTCSCSVHPARGFTVVIDSGAGDAHE